MQCDRLFCEGLVHPRSGGHKNADRQPFLSATGRVWESLPATVPKVKSQPTVPQAARRRPPDVSRAAHTKVARLQAAVDAMGDDVGPEMRILREALKERKEREQRSTRGSPVGCLCSIRGASEGPFVKIRRSLSEGPGKAPKVRGGVARGRGEAGTTPGRSIRVVACTEYERHGSFRRRVEPPTNSDGTLESGGVSGCKQERHLGGCGRVVAVATRGRRIAAFPRGRFEPPESYGIQARRSFIPHEGSHRRRRCQTKVCRRCSRLLRSMRSHSRYGLRATRVGEAQHPGPNRSRSRTRPEDLLQSVEFDLTKRDSTDDERPSRVVPQDVDATQ